MSAASTAEPQRSRAVRTLAAIVIGLTVAGGVGIGTTSARAEPIAADDRSGTFSIATYNVAGLPEGLSSGSPRANTPEMGRRLLRFDVVNVQEDFNYHAALYSTATFPYRTWTTGRVPFGSGLNTMSKFRFTGLERVRWRRCNGTDCLSPKGFTYKRVTLAPGATVDVYNVHTNAGIEAGDLAARRSNLAQLGQFVRHRSAGQAVIIAGDLNARYTRAEDDLVTLPQVTETTDAWLQEERGGQAPAFDPNPAVCQKGQETDSCEIVDKVFYRSGSTVKLDLTSYTNEDRAFLDAAGAPLSDHRPVSSVFSWRLTD